MKKNFFTIGRITGVHGLKGYLKVNSFAESISTFADGLKVFVKDVKDSSDKWYEILNSFPYKKGIALLLKGVDRSIGKTFIGKEILINRNDLPEINEENTWFWEDLIGLKVLDLKLGYLGKIDSVIATGSNDVFIVKNNNKEERLVPCIASVICKVDIDNNEMKIKLPQGL
ncbi:MAG: 16S rRNA processing protein RimM [Desulfobacteraceae bacterium 4572_130]|nr:MAG: 16S rRNA processing protein RimM [Desulfobacteraceae bacterium 4572_130]